MTVEKKSPPTSFRIDFEDRSYDFDMSNVTANEWKSVRAYCGHNPLALFEAIEQSEIEAVEALFWLVMRQNREPAFDFGQRQFGLFAFMKGWNEANEKFVAAHKAAVEDEGDEDPKGSPTPA